MSILAFLCLWLKRKSPKAGAGFCYFLVSRNQVIGYNAQRQAITASALKKSIHKARQEAMDRKVISHEDLKNELIDSIS